MMHVNQYIQNSLGGDSAWIFDSVLDHTINISKCIPLADT